LNINFCNSFRKVLTLRVIYCCYSSFFTFVFKFSFTEEEIHCLLWFLLFLLKCTCHSMTYFAYVSVLGDDATWRIFKYILHELYFWFDTEYCKNKYLRLLQLVQHLYMLAILVGSRIIGYNSEFSPNWPSGFRGEY
jgi:hypothetical protein